MSIHRSAADLQLSHAELHDLCQPLTVLQCRLEMSRIPAFGGNPEEAIDESLGETRRIFDIVARMRERLLLIEQSIEQNAPILEAKR